MEIVYYRYSLIWKILIFEAHLHPRLLFPFQRVSEALTPITKLMQKSWKLKEEKQGNNENPNSMHITTQYNTTSYKKVPHIPPHNDTLLTYILMNALPRLNFNGIKLTTW